MAEKKKPAFEFTLGRIRTAVWPNQSADSDVWYNVTIRRLYMGEKGWRDANSFRRDELPIVSKAADMAYDWIWKRQQASTDPAKR